MTVRNDSGGIGRYTDIPGGSMFATYGGASKATCTFTTTSDDFVLSNGTTVAKGTEVTSHYLFAEGIGAPLPVPPNELPDDVLGIPSKGSIEDATRTFSVFCDSAKYDINFVRIITVGVPDPMLDPRPSAANLRNDLQLIRPTVFTNPIVDRFGGLVTRYPTWLAIAPGAWELQRSDPAFHRGWLLYLYARPARLDFVVSFTPNPDKPSHPYAGIVGCIPSVAALGDASSLPAMPALPEQTEPGVNGPCEWTPPGPGTVTFTARITYEITFWARGYTSPEPDYVWESAPTTFTTGELVAVNTKPGG